LVQRIALLVAGLVLLGMTLELIRREVIVRYLHLLPDGFSASTTTTICLVQRGYEVEFVPITAHKRAGRSTVRPLRDGLNTIWPVSYTHLRAHETLRYLVCRLLLEKKKIAASTLYGLVRAVISREGTPTLAVLVVVTGLITAMFSLLAEQISALRIELFEKDQL